MLVSVCVCTSACALVCAYECGRGEGVLYMATLATSKKLKDRDVACD